MKGMSIPVKWLIGYLIQLTVEKGTSATYNLPKWQFRHNYGP